MEQLKTSIIILAYKEPEKFKRMFETLIQNTSKMRTPFEIIIIDNLCDERILEYLVSVENEVAFNIYHQSENLGTSKGFNLGAQYATGHYLCFFNSDYYMNIGWLDSMIECFKHQANIGLVSCATNASGNKDEAFDIMINRFFESPMQADIPFDYKESDCAIAQMFTTKKIWNEVNGFDENIFFSHEDLDFNLKIKEKGYKIFVDRKTFGFHDHDSEIKKLDFGHKQITKSRKYFNNKWKEKSKQFWWA